VDLSINLKFLLIVSCFCLNLKCRTIQKPPAKSKTNFLFCIADDWSFPHAGAYGDQIVKTPNFDRLAEEGFLFMNAFTAASSCSPSRAAILTGQDMYRLEAGGCLFGTMPQKYPVYTQLLEDAGYTVGHTGKGYAPAQLNLEGWTHNPAGRGYQDIVADVPDGFRDTDYSANFIKFIESKDPDKPFCFWYGSSEPHRRFKYGIGAENDYEIDQVKVPAFLPDTEETRNDVADYYYEVEWWDRHLGEIVDHLEAIGELDNTVIVVTSDNGMPFPRAKTTAYNYGVQMPFAIRWGEINKTKKVIESPISLIDVAPTFLDIAGVTIPKQVRGKSLLNLLIGDDSYQKREFAVSALERHTIARPNNWGYPVRALYTEEYTYIYNFEPDRWPAGAPDFDAWPQGFYGDVDGGPTKTLLLENPAKWPFLFNAALGKRPQEELYNASDDLVNLNNLAADPAYASMKADFKEKLFKYLEDSKDPRLRGISPWDDYYFSGGKEWER